MSSSTTTSTLLPAPTIKEATSDTTGIDKIEVDKLGSNGATLEIPSSAIKPGDRVQAWSRSNDGTVINEIKTVTEIPLKFSVAKENLKKGSTPTFSYTLRGDKGEVLDASEAVPYSIV